MTESIQKKLLRVRPPRVKITYDVETGGALEKKELPFIVGILADLKGDREDPANYESLKTRGMTDVDRDNFNDLMHTIRPRIALANIKKANTDLHALLSDPGDNQLYFTNIDAFEPFNVIQSLPSLSALYQARSQIRGLQAKAEADDDFAEHLDALVQANRGESQSIYLASNQTAITLSDAEKTEMSGKLIVLQNVLAGSDDEAKKTELAKWSFQTADQSALTEAIKNGKTLANALAAPDTAENRNAAKSRLSSLKTAAPVAPPKADEGAVAAAAQAVSDTEKAALAAETALAAAADADKAALQADATAKRQTATDAAAKLASLKATPVEPPKAASAPANPLPTAAQTLINAIDGDALDAAAETGDPVWSLPLLILGLTTDLSAENDPTKVLARDACLGLVKYLTQGDAASQLAAKVPTTVQNIFPLIQNDTARTILALKMFTDELRKYLFDPEKAGDAARIMQASSKGSAAVIDVQVVLIDQILSKALSKIMHSAAFKKAEATWRGLYSLVFNTETSSMLKLRVLNATKDELRKDMQKAVEFDQSVLFKMVYEAEYGTYGGFPYSLLIGDYALGGGAEDIEFLTKMAEVAAAAHAPFIAQASQDLFQLSGFDKLDKPRDLKKIFESADLIGWRSFREMDDARYVSLALPRALLRLPYGPPEKRNTIPCEFLNFDEDTGSQTQGSGETISYSAPNAENFLWGNPAFLLAERITNAFALYNWTAAIRGVEGGGLVENLPAYTYTANSGSTELLCPTEVSITDRREKELNDLGFISLCHCKGTGNAAFFGGQTANLPKKYFSDDANSNAKISALLPYMLAASRFAHYIKVIMREKIGSFLTRANVESYLNTWIANYVLLDDNATQEVKSTYPLRSARVVVTDVPGEPGSYRATVFLKPHFQLEELTTSIRLVAQLPK